MNDFRKEFKEKLDNEIHYSRDMKKRLLNKINSNKSKSTFSIKYVMALVAIVTCSIFSISIYLNTESTKTTTSSLVDAGLNIPFVKASGGQEIVHLYESYMDRGSAEYTKYPIVLDNFDKSDLKRGEVVLFGSYASEFGRIVGLPGEKIKIINGQIYINDQKLNSFYGKAHITGSTSIKSLPKRSYETLNEDTIKKYKKILSKSMDTVYLREDEVFIQADNWLNPVKTLNKVNNIHAKVDGYADVEISFTLKGKEKKIYEEFKISKDKGVLKEVAPISIAKMYLQACLENLPDIQYAFYTERPESKFWSYKDFLKEYQEPKDKLDFKIRNATLYNNIENGVFEKTDESKGVIHYRTFPQTNSQEHGIRYADFLSPEEKHTFHMEQNENGIWLVSFNPVE